MSKDIGECILRTIFYSDIFDYPLKKTEIWKFLISSEKIKKENFNKALIASSLRSGLAGEAISSNKDRRSCLGGLTLSEENNFYYLPDRKKIINERLKKEKESKNKLKIAQKTASILSIIPTIQLIGLSGSLSMENCDENDDIDFFIIVKKNSVWITRLLSLFMLQILGKRRKRNDRKVKNKICINMIIDDSALELSKNRQNLYTAHEVVQLMPLFERQKMYAKFISANKWVKRYLPNASTRGTTLNRTRNNAENRFCVFLRIILCFSVLEYLSKKIQLLSIKRHQTIETVDDHLLAFHPIDYGDIVMKEYNKRLKKYKI